MRMQVSDYDPVIGDPQMIIDHPGPPDRWLERIRKRFLFLYRKYKKLLLDLSRTSVAQSNPTDEGRDGTDRV